MAACCLCYTTAFTSAAMLATLHLLLLHTTAVLTLDSVIRACMPAAPGASHIPAVLPHGCIRILALRYAALCAALCWAVLRCRTTLQYAALCCVIAALCCAVQV